MSVEVISARAPDYTPQTKTKPKNVFKTNHLTWRKYTFPQKAATEDRDN